MITYTNALFFPVLHKLLLYKISAVITASLNALIIGLHSRIRLPYKAQLNHNTLYPTTECCARELLVLIAEIKICLRFRKAEKN